jgi:prevent-host-death family protein
MKEMIAFSTTDLSRKSGDVVAAALRGPITLTQHNKPRLVVLSVEEYELLTARKASDTRTAGLTKDMPADLIEDFRTAALAYIQGEEP